VWTGRAIAVRTKADLHRELALDERLVTSARTGEGIEELKRAILAQVGVSSGMEEAEVVVTSERQRGLLARASERFAAATSGVRQRQPLEMVALDVREGAQALAEVLGEAVGEAVLDELVSQFCIGK